jgi:hypothetical protein
MDVQQMDNKILFILKDLPYFSKLGTFICIRLADYAAQMCGCRSTRQIDDNKLDDIDDQYNYLIDLLKYYIAYIIEYLNTNHKYKKSVLELNDDQLEDLLIDTLFNMTIMDYKNIFIECFFE